MINTRSFPFKITGIIILVAAILIIPAINYFVPRIIENKIADLNNKNLKIQAENIEFNLLRGEIRFTDLIIINSGPEEKIEVKVNQINFYGISIVDLVRGQTIFIRHLHVAGAIIRVTSPDTLLKTEIHKSVMEIPDIRIGNISILDLTFINNNSNSAFNELSLHHAGLMLNDVISAKIPSGNRMMNLKYTLSHLSIPLLHIKTSDQLYSGNLYNLFVSGREKFLIIDSTSLIPTLSNNDYFKKIGIQTDCFTIKTEKIICHYDQLLNLTGNNDLKARVLTIANANFIISRDKNYPRGKIIKPTVQQLLKKLKIPFEIQALYLINNNINYYELGEGANIPAKIRISKSYVKILNITNIDSSGSLEVRGECLLYGEGKANIAFDFPLNENYFISSGSVKDFHFKKLNNLLTENMHITLKGNIEALKWAFKGGEEEATGFMQFTYSNMKVKFEDKDTKKTSGIDEKFKSMMANLILNKNNNQGNNAVSNVPLYCKRDKTRFVFNYFARTLLSGIKTTIGMNPLNKVKNKK